VTRPIADLDRNQTTDPNAQRDQLINLLCKAGCPEWASFVDLAIPPSAEDASGDVRRGGWSMLAEYPTFVASGMRSGRIAKPSWNDVECLYPAEVAEAKAQGIHAAADKLEAIEAHEQDDAGIDLWTAAQIIRDTLSPEGWPALGIRPRPLAWERVDRTDAATKDIFVAFAHSEATGVTYDLSFEYSTQSYDIPAVGDDRYDSEPAAMQAAEAHNQRRLLQGLERDVLGGERVALSWFLRAWEAGHYAEMMPDLAEIAGASDHTAEKRAHQLVRTAIRQALAQSELAGPEVK
jgi:hypothetical protein